MSTLPKVVVIGGTGAQGSEAVRALSETGNFEVVVLTRNKTSSHALALAALPRVSLFEGTLLKESDLFEVFKGAYGAFVNTDSFVIGEKTEIFLGIRIFEIAVGQGVQHYVWGSVYYVSKLGAYDPKYRTAHMDAKGRVADFLLAQQLKGVTVTIFTTCPYAEMVAGGQFTPDKNADGSFTFYSSIGDGVVPVVALADIGPYVSWIFRNRARADNLDFIAVTDILPYSAIVSAFEKVTGKKAHWKDLPYDDFAKQRGMTDDVPAAFAHGPGEYSDPSGLGAKTSFRGFWNAWRDSLFTWDKVDVKLLDEIHPDRIRSLEEWMRKAGYDGEKKAILKDSVDMVSRQTKHWTNTL